MWTRLKVWVVYRCQQFEAEGYVTHARGDCGMGIAFEKMSRESQELLEDWLREVGR